MNQPHALPVRAQSRQSAPEVVAAARSALRMLFAHVRDTGRMSLRMALVLVAAAGPAFGQPPCAPAKTPADATLAAEFTGRLEAGTPVYRLGAITVTANRSVAAVEPRLRNAEATTRPMRRAPSS